MTLTAADVVAVQAALLRLVTDTVLSVFANARSRRHQQTINLMCGNDEIHQTQQELGLNSDVYDRTRTLAGKRHKMHAGTRRRKMQNYSSAYYP
jgi:hypothetical protein